MKSSTKIIAFDLPHELPNDLNTQKWMEAENNLL